MDDKRKQLIEDIAGRLHDARNKLNMLSLHNTYGLNEIEAMQLERDYAVAQAEVFDLESALRAAQIPESP